MCSISLFCVVVVVVCIPVVVAVLEINANKFEKNHPTATIGARTNFTYSGSSWANETISIDAASNLSTRIRSKRQMKSPDGSSSLSFGEIGKSNRDLQFLSAQLRNGYETATPRNCLQAKPDVDLLVPPLSQPQQQPHGMPNEIQPNQLLEKANSLRYPQQPIIFSYPRVSRIYPYALSPNMIPYFNGLTEIRPPSVNYQRVDPSAGFYSIPYQNFFQGFFQPCPAEYYPCSRGGLCVLKSKWCDNARDCPDASDESGCKCTERISKNRRCDDYPDCPGAEDERGCFGCPEHFFSSNYPTFCCIPMEQRCDGQVQCADGKDEANCNVISPYGVDENAMSPVSYNRGYLQKNLRGKWYYACEKAYSWPREACASEFMDMSVKPDVRYASSPIPIRRFDIFLVEDTTGMKLKYECPNQYIYVNCDNLPIGERQTSTNSELELRLLTTNREKNVDEDDNDPMVGIVGGRDSRPRTWPFVISINKNGVRHCGGAILTDRWILSAAHCYLEYEQNYYDVEAGLLRRFSYSPNRQLRAIKEIRVHPGFNELLHNDISLALLREPLLFNRWVKPASLPNPDYIGYYYSPYLQEPRLGETCVIMGWGTTSENTRSNPDNLQEVEVPIVQCKGADGSRKNVICAGYVQGGRDACKGDSGGPMMCMRYTGDSFKWYVGGIVSFGLGCARQDLPGVYTKVSSFYYWIVEQIKNNLELPRGSRLPLSFCPNFSCNQPYPKCLMATQRCNLEVDCLRSEDEINCPVYNRQLFSRESMKTMDTGASNNITR